MKTLLPAQLTKVNSKADRSYDLTFNTQELSGEGAAALLGQLLQTGYLLYSPNDDITETDIPEEPADGGTTKTPAQRLRAVLFIRWKQLGKKGDFQDYYRKTLENFIDSVKEKLE